MTLATKSSADGVGLTTVGTADGTADEAAESARCVPQPVTATDPSRSPTSIGATMPRLDVMPLVDHGARERVALDAHDTHRSVVGELAMDDDEAAGREPVIPRPRRGGVVVVRLPSACPMASRSVGSTGRWEHRTVAAGSRASATRRVGPPREGRVVPLLGAAGSAATSTSRCVREPPHRLRAATALEAWTAVMPNASSSGMSGLALASTLAGQGALGIDVAVEVGTLHRLRVPKDDEGSGRAVPRR